MIGLDTNCLVRLLRDDPDNIKQSDHVRTVVRHAKQVYISPLVLMESEWVFRKIYKHDKKEIVDMMKKLTALKNIVWDNRQVVIDAVDVFHKSNIEFADALLLCLHRDKKIPMLTFDKKLARHPGAQKVSAIKEQNHE